MRRSLGLLLGLPALAAAVFRDEVGDIDFHYALVGLPRPDSTFFHRPRRDDGASLLYTLSDVGVLGAVNPSNGDVVWRQLLADEDADAAGHLRALDGEACVIAARGSRVSAWDALTGRSLWEARFAGAVRDLELLELTEAAPRKDVLALFDDAGATVLRRLDGARGTVVWEFRERSPDVPLHVSNDISSVYVVSLHGAPDAYSLKVTALDTASGARVDHWFVGARGDIRRPADVMFVGANSAAPLVAWASRGRLETLSLNLLGSRAKQDVALPADAVSVRVHAPRLAQSQPHFLLHVQTAPDAAGDRGNKAIVFHTDLKAARADVAYELPAFRGDAAFSTSCDGANVYFTRVGGGETLLVSSDSHAVLARWHADVGAVDAASEVVRRPDGQYAVRAAVVTTSDDWVLVRNGERDWIRHEGLSGAVAAAWAEMPEGEGLARVLAEEAHTNPLAAYLHRLGRHAADLRCLPAHLAAVARRAVDAIAGGEAAAEGEPETAGLHRDSFGFNKILVIATRRGRLYGLDSGRKGRVLWTRRFFPRDAAKRPLRVRSLAATADDDGAGSGSGVMTVYGADGERASFDVTTGAPRGPVVGDGPPVAAVAVVDTEASGRLVVPLGPDGLPAGGSGLPAAWDVGRTVVVGGDGGALEGIRLGPAAAGGPAAAVRQDVWRLPLPAGQRLVEVATRAAHDPVASIGRVLGDRRVLYKYLCANCLVAAAADDAAGALTLRLVDTASGEVLAAQRHEGVDTRAPVSCALAENWYACAFFADAPLGDGSARAVKGHRLVVADLYEAPEPNSRGPRGDAPNVSALAPVAAAAAGALPLPWVVSQAYVVSQPLAALAVTQTRQGIATRELVAALPRAHGVVGLARPALDPRRPVGRDATPAEAEAEGLTRYAPALEIDPRSVLSHERAVVGVAGLIAAPTLVESTSLLAAYGVDVYVARVAPSGVFDILGRGFGKASLVATVAALLAGVLFLAPMVRPPLPLHSPLDASLTRRTKVRKRQIDRLWEANLL